GTVIMPWSTMPLAIVAATATERNAPTRFRTAASPTARRGGSASVAIVVAIAFAVSWNPLVKLNTNAVATVRITSPSTTHSYHRAGGGTIPAAHPNRVIAATLAESA